MLGWRWASGYGNEFGKLASTALAFRRSEIRNVNVRAGAELFPLPFQLKKCNPSGHYPAHSKQSGLCVIGTLVHVGGDHRVTTLPVTPQANTLPYLLEKSYHSCRVPQPWVRKAAGFGSAIRSSECFCPNSQNGTKKTP